MHISLKKETPVLKKFLPLFLATSFALTASPMFDQIELLSEEAHSAEQRHKHAYALLSNQPAVLSGNNILWTNTGGNTLRHIQLDTNGNIHLPHHHGVYLVQYTVRINKSPYNGTSTATVQLQQTVADVPADISQPAVIENIAVDTVTSGAPSSQTQITGYAIVHVTSSHNNVLSLLVNFTGSNMSLPATSGNDANAQISILQIH